MSVFFSLKENYFILTDTNQPLAISFCGYCHLMKYYAIYSIGGYASLSCSLTLWPRSILYAKNKF